MKHQGFLGGFGGLSPARCSHISAKSWPKTPIISFQGLFQSRVLMTEILCNLILQKLSNHVHGYCSKKLKITSLDAYKSNSS